MMLQLSDRANDALMRRCRSHKNLRSHFNRFLHTAGSSKFRSSETPTHLGAGAKRPCSRGSPKQCLWGWQPVATIYGSPSFWRRAKW